MKEQNRFRRLATGIWKFDKKDVVSLGLQLFHTLRQIQDKIGSDRELPLFEFLQAIVDRVRIPVHEKNAKRARSVGLRTFGGSSPRAKYVLAPIRA